MTSHLRLRPFPFSGNAVTAVVTTRHGGVSTGVYGSLNLGDHVGDDHEAVRENRHRLAAELGVDRLTVADQQHGARVAVIGRELAGRGHDGEADARDALPGTDAMVTDLPGVALATIVADCAPVVLFDPVRRAIGVAHCGRRGTVLGTLPKTIEAMRAAFGTLPRDLTAGIGPAIGADSYEIGEAEAAEVTAAFPVAGSRGPGGNGPGGHGPGSRGPGGNGPGGHGPGGHGPGGHGPGGHGPGSRGAGGLLRPTRPGHWTFDMVAALRIQLRDAGVEDIHPMGIDTRTSTDDFFSDRAARPCGRFMAVAMLPA